LFVSSFKLVIQLPTETFHKIFASVFIDGRSNQCASSVYAKCLVILKALFIAQHMVLKSMLCARCPFRRVPASQLESVLHCVGELYVLICAALRHKQLPGTASLRASKGQSPSASS